MGHVVDQGQVSRVDQPPVAGQTRHEEGDTRHGERANGEFRRHHVERGTDTIRGPPRCQTSPNLIRLLLPMSAAGVTKKPAMNASTIAKDCR